MAEAGPEEQRERVGAAFAALGIEAVVELVSGANLPRTLHQIVARPVPRVDAIVIGGGDGSINAAASHMVGSNLPLGVLPLGTLNHFAKDLALPLDLDGATRVIAAGHVRHVDVGEVNGRLFVNNSSIGIYPYMLASRLQQQRELGRGKWAAMAVAALYALRRFPMHRLVISTGRGVKPRRTPCAFIGNNMYVLDPLFFGGRTALDRGELCVCVANSSSRLRFLVLTLRVALGRARGARDFELIKVHEVEIVSHARRLRVAVDGELEIMRPPLRYRIRPRALRVFAPLEAPAQ